MSEQSWVIRPANESDINFIYSTWIKSFRTGSGLGLASGKYVYFTLYQFMIDQILHRKECEATVAADPSDPLVIYGYIVHEPGVLHYAFTKEAFRRLGVAKALYRECFDTLDPPVITHETVSGSTVTQSHPELLYKPIRLFPKGSIIDERT